MKTIVYIGNFAFPDKNASGKRVLANCLCFQKIGFRTVCIGPGEGKHEIIHNVSNYTIKVGNSIKRATNRNIDRIVDIIRSESGSGEVRAVVIYGAIYTQSENLLLIRWCHNHKIKVIYDQVDWLELNWHNPLRAIMRAVNHFQMNHMVIPKCDGVICISSFLEKYHKKNRLNTLVIPPLSTVTAPPILQDTDNDTRPIRFVYAGTSSDVRRPVKQWKDRLDLVFLCFSELINCEKTRPFIIDVYGLTLQQYINMFPKRQRLAGKNVIDKLQDKVVFHGKVENSVAVKGIQKADFTILLRDVKRSTTAGFPTKISESISYGTPVICNDTSDLAQYIISGENGIIVPMNELQSAIYNVLKMSNKEIFCYKSACANNPFDYANYIQRFKVWFGDLGL